MLKSIRQRRERLFKRMERLQGEIEALQGECSHQDYVYRYGANTGNFDPSSDCYWTDFECLDCGRRECCEGSLSKWPASEFGGAEDYVVEDRIAEDSIGVWFSVK